MPEETLITDSLHIPDGQVPQLVLVGTDYRRADVQQRERVSFDAEEGEEVLINLLARPEVSEAYLLSTCNRTEVYLVPREGHDAYACARDLIFQPREPALVNEGRLYIKRHREAVEHLLGVACGLESMVLGEPEILGQVKQAGQLAAATGAAGEVLQRLLRGATSSGRRARSQTSISVGAVSFGYAALDLARSIYSSLETRRVLLVGAGEMAHQVARNLRDQGVTDFVFTNRGQERADRFQEAFPQAQRRPFSECQEALEEADLTVVSTAADRPVLSQADVEAAARRRADPLLLVDLSLPRNIDPAAAKVDNVFLYDLDSLDTLIQRNLRRRREEVPQVEEIIHRETDQFFSWLQGLEAEPVIARLQQQAEGLRREVVERARGRFPESTHEDLDRLTRALVRKLLHHPSAGLRRDQTTPSQLELVRELFQLNDGYSPMEEPVENPGGEGDS
ncbi:MAG: glutamyl-tRNA reductase [Acidobacteriota bacterium]